jgi:hypothetical protein
MAKAIDVDRRSIQIRMSRSPTSFVMHAQIEAGWRKLPSSEAVGTRLVGTDSPLQGVVRARRTLSIVRHRRGGLDNIDSRASLPGALERIARAGRPHCDQ